MSYMCVVCGSGIATDGRRDWHGSFRVVYADPEMVGITGVGLYNQMVSHLWSVPIDPVKNWQDELSLSEKVSDISLMREPSRQHRHGFVVHESCWMLLGQVFNAEGVPLDRFFTVLSSLPFLRFSDQVFWGHNYNGLLLSNGEAEYPYEDWIKPAEDCRMVYKVAWANPWEIPDVARIQQEAEDDPPPSIASRNFSQDWFSRLPLEITRFIAHLLPTCDALTMRLVSPVFLRIFSDQQFWASRFKPGGECDHLFEVSDSKVVRDFRRFYRGTGPNRFSVELQNRARLWPLIKSIKEHMLLEPHQVHIRYNLRTDHGPWLRAGGNVSSKGTQTDMPLEHGCRIFAKSCVALPTPIQKIAISMLKVQGVTHIVGLRFIGSTSTAEQCLGYLNPKNEVICEVSSLHGLICAVGPRGVHALQILHHDGSRSQWFGNPRRTPITERLCIGEAINVVEAELDGYKICALSVAGAPTLQSDALKLKEITLRRAALWYPCVPDLSLDLNETSFVGEPVLARTYRPVNWVPFGGTDGFLLSHLTEISAVYRGNVQLIEFHYDDNASSVGVMRLGKSHTGRVELKDRLRMPIDGKGGERIISFGVTTKQKETEDGDDYNYLNYGKLSSLRITTNRGKTYTVGPSDPSAAVLSITPETTIVGIYGSHHVHSGIIDMGVASAKTQPPVEESVRLQISPQ